ncbi:MAG: tRNA pseudouridine(38-40) synthase TruA [Nitrospiraceae bacterium]|nr:MAG: tRNA pseudouridine(38-40) synthase TruA [Nitrospiraceae bacterium]
MRQIQLLLAYNGTDYQGWQQQKTGRTIQGILCETIQSITSEHTRLTAASRTDAGVHALGQVAVVRTRSGLSPDVLMRACNAKLPDDIRILQATEVHERFSPRYRARRKRYFYMIFIGRNPSVFFRHYVWDIKAQLDLDKMTYAAQYLLGEHDFSCFKASGCGSKRPVRTIFSLDITTHKSMNFMKVPIKGHFIRISVEADAFLRHMVRNIVGTLVEIGRGTMTPDIMTDLLKSRDRKRAGPTAPAKGLFLEKIIY